MKKYLRILIRRINMKKRTKPEIADFSGRKKYFLSE